jgi:hypothetical protein
MNFLRFLKWDELSDSTIAEKLFKPPPAIETIREIAAPGYGSLPDGNLWES